MTSIRFFVIGSWSEGMFHFQKLRSFINYYEPAKFQGIVYRLPIGFPVLVAQNDSNPDLDLISGQLIDLKYDETLITLMDSLHGVNNNEPEKGLHRRLNITVTKANGDKESAYVYFFNPKKLSEKAKRIPEGLWQKSLELIPALPEQLTDRQKNYVIKLGSAKGRDIVPINDLSLYRELMKLELIVDKGRRLALSQLGKDVYNHLI